jgi:hypothetical protein
VSDALEAAYGPRRREDSVLIPLDAFHSRSWDGGVSKTGTGGSLVGTGHMADAYEQHLFSDSFLLRAGARYIEGLVGGADIPRGLDFAQAEHIDETANTPQVLPTWDSIECRPASAGAHIPFTRRMSLQSSPVLSAILVPALGESLRELAEYTALFGSGVGEAPTGIFNLDGVTELDSFDPDSFAEWQGMWRAAREAKARGKRPGFISDFTTMTRALTTPRTEGDATMVAQLVEGAVSNLATIGGLPFYASQLVPTEAPDPGSPSTIVPAQYIGFNSGWDRTLLLVWGALEVTLTDDPAQFKSGGKIARAFLDYTIVHTSPQDVVIYKNPSE